MRLSSILLSNLSLCVRSFKTDTSRSEFKDEHPVIYKDLDDEREVAKKLKEQGISVHDKEGNPLQNW